MTYKSQELAHNSTEQEVHKRSAKHEYGSLQDRTTNPEDEHIRYKKEALSRNQKASGRLLRQQIVKPQ